MYALMPILLIDMPDDEHTRTEALRGMLLGSALLAVVSLLPYGLPMTTGCCIADVLHSHTQIQPPFWSLTPIPANLKLCYFQGALSASGLSCILKQPALTPRLDCIDC